MAGGVNPNLSGAQFGAPSFQPAPTPAFQQPRSRVSSPLPYSSNTNSSAKAAAAWRHPEGSLLGLSNATFGSVFKPFG